MTTNKSNHSKCSECNSTSISTYDSAWKGNDGDPAAIGYECYLCGHRWLGPKPKGPGRPKGSPNKKGKGHKTALYCSLPKDVMYWLKSQVHPPSTLIETALREYYKI